MRHLLNNLSTNKTSEKVTALIQYFQTATDEDKVWLIALFTGRRPKINIKTALLRQWAAEFAQIPHWLFEESYAIVGDLAETIALLIDHDNQNLEFRLDYWMQELKRAKSMTIEEQKDWIFKSWKSLGKEDRFIFNKLLTGGFRIGISEALLVQALSQYTGIEKSDLFYRLTGKWDPYSTKFKDFLVSSSGENESKPYPFYLAYPIERIEDLGDLKNWQVEYKWDGIRGQLIKRGDQITIWSRGEEIITPSFPEIVNDISKLTFDGVMDGEIIAWDFDKNQPRPFAELQKRLGRKSPSKKLIINNPTAFICYDLLEYNNTDLRSQPLHKRRIYLQNLFEPPHHKQSEYPHKQSEHPHEQSEHPHKQSEHPHEQSEHPHKRSEHPHERSEHPHKQSEHPHEQSEHPHKQSEHPHKQSEHSHERSEYPHEQSEYTREQSEYAASKASIILSKTLHPQSFQELSNHRETAKLQHTEGLMIKRRNSTYGVGRKRGDWWKWKVDPETADAVMIYAQKGHGKRASLYTDFTFALKKGEELVPFAKAYSGLTKKEIEEINRWIKDHTRERFGPVCSVDAELVFEIAFEGINKSSRHKSGIAVRFPRILRWRRDKKLADINSVEDLIRD